MKQNLEEICRMFSFQCSQKNLQLNFSLMKDLPQMIYTDKNRLNQILINLLNNALKFTYTGSITLQVQNDPKDSSSLEFKVSDTGIGIKTQDKEKLFKMYGRVDQRDYNINTQGVGLDLTISNELARLLNSNQQSSGIKFQSGFSQGSTFSFCINKSLEKPSSKEINVTPFPPTKDYKFINSVNLHANESPRLPLIPSKTPSFSLQNKSTPTSKISSISSMSTNGKSKSWALLVDDMPFNLIVASHILGKNGLNVKTALNGKEAIGIVNEHYKKGEEFKFILMDCQMPIMDGFEAAEALTELMKAKLLPQISIIAFSANNSRKDIEKAKKSGMCDFLFKPFEEEQFTRVISTQNIKI